MDEAAAEQVKALARATFGDRVTLTFHPQCFLRSGHFAGPDRDRTDAFVSVANDSEHDVVWFARGGYGSVRIVEDALPRLNAQARRKLYLGYSDMGSVMGALRTASFPLIAHAPMPADILRPQGDQAVLRALAFALERREDALEPSVRDGRSCLAFNMTIFSKLIGTPWLPDLAGQVLLLEEVSEYMYSIDRNLAHITSCPQVRRIAGIRLGRCSLVPPNEPEFAMTEVEVVEFWCRKAGIAYLGRADIGHDVQNKVVPFGGLDAFRSVA
jgi:muramoyltetrapeptide carboxypeptidase